MGSGLVQRRYCFPLTALKIVTVISSLERRRRQRSDHSNDDGYDQYLNEREAVRVRKSKFLAGHVNSPIKSLSFNQIGEITLSEFAGSNIRKA